MKDRIEGYLHIGANPNRPNEVVINLPKLDTDVNGMSYIVFSANQARQLAKVLWHWADEVDVEKGKMVIKAQPLRIKPTSIQ